MKNKRTTIMFISAWMILIAISFLWNYTNARKEQERIALQSARSFFDHIIITRLWNVRHGGLYAPVTEKTLPNPYLDVPMRDIEVNNTLKLTKINPAFMTRQISEISMEQEGVQFHITSLKPLRPQNKPTVRETIFLKEFEKGIKEKSMLIKERSTTSFFFMAPLKTTKSCLKCHDKQGYNEGDVRGGISVTLPVIMKIPFLPLLFGHIVIGLIGLYGIVITVIRLNKAYEKLERQAVFDALTGVPNRRNFSEKILADF